MTFTEQLLEQAKKEPKKIIFPEADEEKILLAARKVKDYQIAYPILIGESEKIKETANQLNISLDGIHMIDHTDEELKQNIIKRFLKESDFFSEKALNRKFKRPLNFAAALVKLGEGDCLAAGITHTTGEVILAAQSFIGMLEGISTVSSIGIVEFPDFKGSEDNFVAFTDCAVNPNPSSEELADIAIASADTVSSLLNWEPRVGMLSFSTKGSSEHEDVQKVVKAVEIAREKRPCLLIDGEFQLDAAVLPQVAAKKVKEESIVAGKANIVVFPDLGAGNIGVKIAQIFAHATAHGPLLQGFSKPVTDFSRSAPIEEIVGNLTMLVVRAQQKN